MLNELNKFFNHSNIYSLTFNQLIAYCEYIFLQDIVIDYDLDNMCSYVYDK